MSVAIKLYVPHSKSQPADPTSPVGTSTLSDAKNAQLACIKRFTLNNDFPTFDYISNEVDQRLKKYWRIQRKPGSLLLYLDDEAEWVEFTNEDDLSEAFECDLNLIHILVPEVMPLFDRSRPRQNQQQQQVAQGEQRQAQNHQQHQQDSKQQQLEQRQQLYSSVVHPHICCDGCQTLPVSGIRFRCRTRHDFDLCYACYTGNVGREMRAKNHVFMEINNPFDDEMLHGVFIIDGENWNVEGNARTLADVPPDPSDEWIVDKFVDE